MKTPKLIDHSCTSFPEKKRFLIHSSGHSMLKTLSVLAVVGILSIVGIVAIPKAMLSHKANRLLDDTRLAGLVVLDEYLDKLTLEKTPLEGKFDKQTLYDFTAMAGSEEDDTFVVMVNKVPYDICKEVIKKRPKWAEEIVVNGEENACHKEGDNLVAFTLNDEGGKLSDYCAKDSDCGDCSKCKNNLCSYGFKNKDEICFECDSLTAIIDDVDAEECARCHNRMWSTLKGGRCVLRLENVENILDGCFWDSVSKEECERFPNQYFGGGHCIYCTGIFDPATGVCSSINDCQKNQIPGAPAHGGRLGFDRNNCDLCGGTFTQYTHPQGDTGGCHW